MSEQSFFSVVTDAGAAELAGLLNNALPPAERLLSITQFAVGDGGGAVPVPDKKQTALINERYRAAVNAVRIERDNPNQVVVECILPAEVGGFYVRETALISSKGTMLVVGNCAPAYKALPVEGSPRTQFIKMTLFVSNAAEVVLKVDSTTVLATQSYVDDGLEKHRKTTDHPRATVEQLGFTQLSDSVASTSSATAATSKAVKSAYDLAASKYSEQAATTAQKGVVQLSNATDSISETLAATPKAVKAAYDLATSKYSERAATTAQKGVVQLSSATDSISETLAATPKAVKLAYDLAASKYSEQAATTAQRGVVQLSSATNSTSETLAATPNAIKIAMDNANARLAKDQNGADIFNKPLFIQNVGLQETVNKAASAVQRTGDKMVGQLKMEGMDALRIFNAEYGLIFRRSENSLWMIPTEKGQGENGTIGPLRPLGIGLDTGQVRLGNGARIDGALSLGTENALGGNSIVLGDSDTGFKQNGDGILDVYANNQHVFRFHPSTLVSYRQVAYQPFDRPIGGGGFADQLNNGSAPFLQAMWGWNPAPGGYYVPLIKGLSTRNGQGYPTAVSFGYLLKEYASFPSACIHIRGDNGDALWIFNPDNKEFNAPGKISPGDYSNFDARYISAVRLGPQALSGGLWRDFWLGGGNVVTGFQTQGSWEMEAGDDKVYYRPIQYLINGTWVTAASA